MDALILALAFVIGIPTSVGAIFSLTDLFSDNDNQRFFARSIVGIALTCIAMFTWAVLANIYYKPTPTITYHKIEELRNVPFYFNENNKPIEITGDGKFADPKTTQVRITIVPGGWKWLMYVTEVRKVEFVKVEAAAVEK